MGHRSSVIHCEGYFGPSNDFLFTRNKITNTLGPLKREVKRKSGARTQERTMNSPASKNSDNSQEVAASKAISGEAKDSKKPLSADVGMGPPPEKAVSTLGKPPGDIVPEVADIKPKTPSPDTPSPETDENEGARLATDLALAEAENIRLSESCGIKNKSLDLPSPEGEEDDDIRLAMEMALAAAQNPHLSPAEIQKLVGEKNAQAKMIDEFSKQNEEKIKRNQEKVREKKWGTKAESAASSWWAAATKKAEEMKDRAERRMYADQISKDEKIIEMRKKMKIVRKTLKAHRLQGNRVETRHVFKRQRTEKKLMQSNDKLKRTQHLFTHSSYNVQEYLKATMRASKKWRKIGTDEEVLLEAQLARNMHQMLALEKQKIKCKKNTKEMKKYLQRCKGWLSDKKAFCEMNIMTLEATQSSMLYLCEDTLRRQDLIITRLKASDEFKGVDLSTVDVSHIDFSKFSSVAKDPERSAATNAMRGLPINDSIRVKKEHLERASSSAERKSEHEGEEVEAKQRKNQGLTRQQLVEGYYKQQEQLQEAGDGPELYIIAKDDISVSSRLSDPDASFNEGEEESESNYSNFGQDAPWMASSASNVHSIVSNADEHAAAVEATKERGAMSPKPTQGAPPAAADSDTKPPAKISASITSDKSSELLSSSDEAQRTDTSAKHIVDDEEKVANDTNRTALIEAATDAVAAATGVNLSVPDSSASVPGTELPLVKQSAPSTVQTNDDGTCATEDEQSTEKDAAFAPTDEIDSNDKIHAQKEVIVEG